MAGFEVPGDTAWLFCGAGVVDIVLISYVKYVLEPHSRTAHKSVDPAVAQLSLVESPQIQGVPSLQRDTIDHDEHRVVEEVLRNAVEGYADAQYVLGVYYYGGAGGAPDYAEAVKWFTKAAGQDHYQALSALSQCYTLGYGVPRNIVEGDRYRRKARELGNTTNILKLLNYKQQGFQTRPELELVLSWFLRAAKMGLTASQRTLADWYVCFEDDIAEATKWRRILAEEGDADEQTRLGIDYTIGGLVHLDPVEAAKWFRKAAERGHAHAQSLLATCYRNGEGVPQDYGQAAMWYRKAAEQGDATAQYFLAQCHQNGEGVPVDYGQAVMWYRKAAEQGDATAQWALGVCYHFGEGVTQDDREAAKWFRKAADQGLAAGQLHLASFYENGQGVPQDNGQAVFWYRKAAEQGDALAQCSLGLCFLRGRGVSESATEAAKLLRQSADQGNGLAQEILGRLYSRGLGVIKDPKQAYGWFLLSGANGNSRSASALAETEPLLSPAEILEAREWAKNWQPTQDHTGTPKTEIQVTGQ